MEKKRKRSGGPKTDTGRQTSSRNAVTHGGCSKLLIVKGECQEEYDALRDWWFGHYDEEQAGRPLLEEALLNEWLLRRAQRNYLAVEARLAETDPNEWSEEQFHRLHLMQRYKVAAERSFHRSQAAVERFRRTRVYEGFAQARADAQVAERARQEREEAEAKAPPKPPLVDQYLKLPPVRKVPSLYQYVTVRETEGRTVTERRPSNEELRAELESKEPRPERVFRRFCFHMDDFPPGYEWGHEQMPRSLEQVMTTDQWQWVVEREKDIPGGHAGPAEMDESWLKRREPKDAKNKDTKERERKNVDAGERRTEDSAGTVGGSVDRGWEDGDPNNSGERSNT